MILIPSEISGTEGVQPCSNPSPTLLLPGMFIPHSASAIIESNPSHFTDMETKIQRGEGTCPRPWVVSVQQLCHEKGHLTPKFILLAYTFLG